MAESVIFRKSHTEQNKNIFLDTEVESLLMWFDETSFRTSTAILRPVITHIPGYAIHILQGYVCPKASHKRVCSND